MFDKYIQVVDVLKNTEAEDIITLAEHESRKQNWSPSNVISKYGGVDISPSRTSEGFPIYQHFPMHDLITDRLNKGLEAYTKQILEDIPKDFLRLPMPLSANSSSRMEWPSILRYTEGQHYNWHHDADPNNRDSRCRTISVVLYLNDNFEGGGTEFIDKVRKPEPGQALFFPSNWTFLHSAQPVTKGKKYSLVTWYTVWDRT